jgi:adenine phosphoribosyltransferase
MQIEKSAESVIKGRIRAIPDYPKKGIIFRDITPLLKDRKAFSICIEELAKRLSAYKPDYIVGIEARGFIVGSALAYKMGLGFIPIRKKGKLPYDKISKDYYLEYGVETMELHKDSVEKGSRVFIVDDLLATGGTAEAAAGLVKSLGGSVLGFAFIIELSDLNGRQKLGGSEIISLVTY